MPRAIPTFIILLLASTNFAPVFAQNQPKLSIPSQQPAATQLHEAKPADVASPDAILAAAYDVISGPKGQERDWERMRSLFYPGAQLISTRVKKEAGLSATFVTPEGYIVRAGSYFKTNGFFERELRAAANGGAALCRFSAPTNRGTIQKIRHPLRGGSTVSSCSSTALVGGL
jgi:hypothetical protein